MNAPAAQHLPAIQQRQGFSESTALMAAESAASAQAAQAKALVEARYIMALKRPRSWDQVRQDILHECKRPSFANNKSAYYKKPIGQGVEGLGIRFAEVALRCMTNVTVETMAVYEDPNKEIVRVVVTDLEANTPWSLDVSIARTVERSKYDQETGYISVRKNSRGADVYTVRAEDEDMLNKRAALISKAVRTLALRLIPGDIQDEAEELIKRVRTDAAAADPDGERKRIIDAFAQLNVKASDLHLYVGHGLDNCSPTELVDLRGIYGAIKDGEATWAQVMANKAEMDKKQPADGGDGKTEKPALSAEAFEKNLPKWKKTIAAKQRTPDEVISTVQLKNSLSEVQMKAIRDLALDPAAPASDEQLAHLVEAGIAATISEPEIVKHLGVEKLRGITVEQLRKAEAFIADPAGSGK